MKQTLALFLLAAAALSAACSNDDNTGLEGQGRLRIVHVSPDDVPELAAPDGCPRTHDELANVSWARMSGMVPSHPQCDLPGSRSRVSVAELARHAEDWPGVPRGRASDDR